MSFSNYLENALLGHVFSGVPYFPAPFVYVALFTSSPTDEDSGTEVSGTGYIRVAATFTPPIDGVVSNVETVTFPTAEASWGSVTHFGVYDAETEGNLLGWSELSTPKTIGLGDLGKFAAGALSITLD